MWAAAHSIFTITTLSLKPFYNFTKETLLTTRFFLVLSVEFCVWWSFQDVHTISQSQQLDRSPACIWKRQIFCRGKLSYWSSSTVCFRFTLSYLHFSNSFHFLLVFDPCFCSCTVVLNFCVMYSEFIQFNIFNKGLPNCLVNTMYIYPCKCFIESHEMDESRKLIG